MAVLVLTEELARTLLGALLAVCRADGDVNRHELDELRAAAVRLCGDVEEMNEALLFSQVTPRALAEAIGRQARSHGPFRGAGTSAPDTIAREFVQSALRIATVDGSINDHEASLIRAFARAIGYDSSDLDHLDVILETEPVA